MSDLAETRDHMAAAEISIREAMFAGTPAARCEAVMDRYWHTPEDRRDAFVAVLVARLTLVRPAPTQPKPAQTAGAAA